MYTGRYGVTKQTTNQSGQIQLTDIEWTLVDISVRPIYSGGVYDVLEIYKRAQEYVSPEKLAATLVALNYTYPYHQVIGFYLDAADVYDKSTVEQFLSFDQEYDFYLTHQMNEPTYSEKWRLYYPKDLELMIES